MGADPLLVIVVAVAENGVIGNAGELPWHISTDLKRFRRLTMGTPMVMGRKTFTSIGKPLDGRDNIVVTRNHAFAPDGVLVAHDMEAALAVARDRGARRATNEITVIGGGEIFAETLPLTDRIELTRVHASPHGDTFFPEFKEDEWEEVCREHHQAGPRDSADCSFIRLERREAGTG